MERRKLSEKEWKFLEIEELLLKMKAMGIFELEVCDYDNNLIFVRCSDGTEP